MKKLFLLTTITCMSLAVSAQSYFGIKAGGGISMLTPATYTHVPGMNVGGGVSFKHNIFKRVVLEYDALFEMRSASLEDPNVTSDLVDGVMNSMYAVVPVTIHYNIPFNKQNLVPYRTGTYKSFWFVEGGPFVGYGITADTYYDDVAASEKRPAELTAGGIDAGITAGLGVNLAFNNSLDRLVIGARGSYGFLNYNKYAGAPTFNAITAGGYIAYDFKLTKKRYYQHRW